MNSDKPFRGRLLLVGVITTLALSVGGVAYAVTGDQPAPDPGYVQIVEGDRMARETDHRDCPDKQPGGGGDNAQNAADNL